MNGYGGQAPVFRTGLNVERIEFRHTDAAGRPVDAAAETPTQRAERIWQLQDQRMAQGDRTVPATDPAAVLAEWFAQSPANRMGAFAMSLAEHPERMPQCETEPGPDEDPVPGGLIEKMMRVRRRRGSQS